MKTLIKPLKSLSRIFSLNFSHSPREHLIAFTRGKAHRKEFRYLKWKFSPFLDFSLLVFRKKKPPPRRAIP